MKLNTNDFFTLEFAKNECDIAQNQCIWKVEFRFGSFGFGSVNLTEISVSVVSVFTCFGRPLDWTCQDNLKYSSEIRVLHSKFFPAIHFKICYILCIKKAHIDYLVFHFVGFHTNKIKCMARIFCWAQTSYLWRVTTY